jgi:hypothetical protein
MVWCNTVDENRTEIEFLVFFSSSKQLLQQWKQKKPLPPRTTYTITVLNEYFKTFQNLKAGLSKNNVDTNEVHDKNS